LKLTQMVSIAETVTEQVFRFNCDPDIDAADIPKTLVKCALVAPGGGPVVITKTEWDWMIEAIGVELLLKDDRPLTKAEIGTVRRAVETKLSALITANPTLAVREVLQ
jgi:hypothetical protein